MLVKTFRTCSKTLDIAISKIALLLITGEIIVETNVITMTKKLLLHTLISLIHHYIRQLSTETNSLFQNGQKLETLPGTKCLFQNL